MKFLVLWRLRMERVSTEMVRAVMRMPDHGAELEREGKVIARYHIVGYHGGAWIYNVASNEELEMLLARAPVYNIASYEVLPLADMGALPVTGE